MARKVDISRFFLVISLLLLCFFQQGLAQLQDTLPAQRQVTDTGQIIHLLNADILLGIQGNGKDSAQMQKLIGNVRLQQGETIFTCDSALQYLSKNTIDAYGHIHINQADTINTYADFLHYEGNTKLATLKKNVKMTDGHMILTTNFLTYDMNSHIGSYQNGGKLVNQETILDSRRGYYYADTKDVFFKNDVKLNNPQYTLTTDTLKYNTISHIATFIAPTAINTGKTIIYTSCGYYKTDQQYAHLCNRPTINDSTGTLTADSLNFSKMEGIGKAFGNVIWSDTSGQATVKSQYAVSRQAEKTILATQQPLLILSQKSDTLFVASDTLFSGPVVQRDTATPKANLKESDTLSYVYINPDNPVAKNYRDSLKNTNAFYLPPLTRNTRTEPLLPQTITFFPPGKRKKPAPEKAINEELKIPPSEANGVPLQIEDTTGTFQKKDSADLRYMIAYHHVQLFSDSLQGLADSLHYSDVDSAFHFYGNPVLWTGVTQLTGDTIVLFTKDQKASRLLLQENAMIVNKVGPNQYNQIKGNIITGYFNDSSQLEWMEVQGNAESIYWAQEDNGAFVGVNQTTSASIRLYFKENQLNKVVFIKQASGTFKNPVGLTDEDKKLKDFRWEAEKRPQSKEDLFRSKNINNGKPGEEPKAALPKGTVSTL